MKLFRHETWLAIALAAPARSAGVRLLFMSCVLVAGGCASSEVPPTPDSGASGRAGTTGAGGAAGRAGVAGAAGTTGVAGAAGMTGVAGASGTAGTTGTAGTAGIAGAAGTAGTAGTAGAAGAAGASGTSGAAGGGGRGGAAGGAGSTGAAGAGGAAGTTSAGGRGGAAGAAGTAGIAGASGRGGAAGGAGTAGAGNNGGSGTGGAAGAAGTSGAAGAAGAAGAGSCASALSARVRITEIDVGATYGYNEVDNNGPNLGLTPLAIAPVPGGGSRLGFLGRTDGMVHVVTLDAADQIVAGSAFTLPAYDFQDIYADAAGGVMLLSRPAMGATANNNCGDINHLCGLVANFPTAASCHDMYMVRFDGSTQTWAAKLTDTSASLPAYGTSATGGSNVTFIWSQYAHNGRIAFDGTNYAGYFGAAITVPGQACQGSSAMANGVNIHQGDRMKVVSGSGALLTTGFDWGCSHSGYERVAWDPTGRKFVAVCKNDAPTGGKSGRLALSPGTVTVYPVDLSYAQLGNVIMAGGGGYWLITSDIRAGQPANANGLADIQLLHVASTASPTPDRNLTLVSDAQNDRAPHLAGYGAGQMLAAWETSTATGDFSQTAAGRQMFLQVLDAATGMPPAGATTASAGPLRLTPNVVGSRYQDFRAYPDGSVAYPAPGSSATKIKILRVLGCN